MKKPEPRSLGAPAIPWGKWITRSAANREANLTSSSQPSQDSSTAETIASLGEWCNRWVDLRWVDLRAGAAVVLYEGLKSQLGGKAS